MPLALLAKRPLVHFDLRSEDESAVPLLRSDEAQLISRELLYLALDLDAEDADTVDAAPLIEWILAARPGESEAVDAAVGELEEQLGPLPGFAALAAQLASGFLLCAVLNDVTRRRVIKFAYDEPLARPGRSAHFYDAPGCTRGGELPRRGRGARTRCGRARPRWSTTVTGAVLAAGPRDADRPAIHYVADAGTRVDPGLSVSYGTERGRFLVPAALVAWVIALGLALPWLFADLAALASVRRPGDRRAALVVGDLLRARAAQRRASAGAARARALPAVPGGGDRRRGGRGWRRSRSTPRAGRSSRHGESAPLWPSWRRVS